MKNCHFIYFDARGNSELGYLVALEGKKDISFDIKRVYYTYGVPKTAKRGMHAHRDLNQVLVCLNGELTIRCFDGKEDKVYKLSNPKEGLYIGPMIWHEMVDYKEDTVLLVLASDFYNEKDYIRDYDEFISLYKKSVDKEKS